MSKEKLTAKQALQQLHRQVARLKRFVDQSIEKGLDPWKLRLDIASIEFAIPLVEERMKYNAAHHEGGTQPTALQIISG